LSIHEESKYFGLWRNIQELEQRIWDFSLYLFRLAQSETEAMEIIHATEIAH